MVRDGKATLNTVVIVVIIYIKLYSVIKKFDLETEVGQREKEN